MCYSQQFWNYIILYLHFTHHETEAYSVALTWHIYTSDASCCDYNQRGSEWISLSLFFQSHTFIYLTYLLSTYYVLSTENTAMNKTDNKTRKLIYVILFWIGLVIEGKEEGCFDKAVRQGRGPVKVRRRNIPAKTKVLGE